MNQTLAKYARRKIWEGLRKLPEDWQDKFALMYGAKGMAVKGIVKMMPDGKLDWALTQVENSLKKVASRSESP